MSERNLSARGLWAAATAFAIWGLLPLYLRPLYPAGALQFIAHRVAWSCVLVLGVLAWRGELGRLVAAVRTPRVLGRLVLTTLLISTNWLVYVWSVGNGHVIETSLGYFINPLVNVLLGVLVLRERLSSIRWVCVGLAAVAVVYLTASTGRPPWIALTLAASFSLYGLLRKITAVEALPGLATETLLLTPCAVGYLVWCEARGQGALGHSSMLIDVLLIGSGAVTAVPLVLFAYGARLIPYSTLGLMQYIAPSLQLMCGVFFYHEPFGQTRQIGFELIWTALAIYAAEGLWKSRRLARRRAMQMGVASE